MIKMSNYYKLILYLSIFIFCFDLKAENQLVADLSQDNVEISTDFLGAKILLFGAYDGKKGDDIIVVVTGPKGLVTVQKKERVLGVWVNTRKVNYINAPKYLHISSNRDINEILNQKTRKISEIGLNNLNVRIQPGERISKEKEKEWRQALTRNMLKSKLWSLNEDSVALNKNTLFKSSLTLPSNVPTGIFNVKILHYRNNNLISKEMSKINVLKSGISAEIYNIAHNYSTLYGIFAVLLAVLIGWVTNLMFRKI